MKLHTNKTFVRVEGALDSKNFKIHEGPKLIKLLSENLYKDRILAIVRELSTNCFDSHSQSGIPDKQFDLKLPTTFSANFEIRDYGSGLSPTEIDEVYRYYGKSSKDNSNDLVGALGLGCKCPFSYHTKSFSVESIYSEGDKKKQDIYTAYINEEGIPNIDLLSSNETTEPTGVKVTVPCDKDDIYNFQTAASKVFPWFKTQPKFLGGNKPVIPKVENLLESPNGWAIRKENYALHNGAIALMGCVGYPIRFEDSNLKDEYRALFDCPITIKFELGELDIQPSREELSYDTQSKTNIIVKFKTIIDELKGKVEDELAQAKTLFEARKKIGSILAKLISPKLQALIPLDQCIWNGQPLFPPKFVNSYSLSCYLPDELDSAPYPIHRVEKNRWNKISVSGARYLSWTDEWVVIESDLKLGNQARAKEYIADHNNINYVFLVSFPKASQRKEFVDLLGMEDKDIIKASTLPKPTPAIRVASGTSRLASTKVMEYNCNGGRSMTSWWKQATIDLSTVSGFWVELNNASIYETNGIKRSPDELSKVKENINILRKNHGLNEVNIIYGIKSAVIPKLKKYPTTWVNIFDLIKEEKDRLAQDKDFITAKIIDTEFSIGGSDYVSKGTHQYRYFYKLELQDLMEIKKRIKKKNTLFVEWVEALEKLNKIVEDNRPVMIAYRDLNRFYQPVELKVSNIEDEEKIQNKIYKEYPLLKNLNQYFEEYDNVVPYIEALS